LQYGERWHWGEGRQCRPALEDRDHQHLATYTRVLAITRSQPGRIVRKDDYHYYPAPILADLGRPTANLIIAQKRTLTMPRFTPTHLRQRNPQHQGRSQYGRPFCAKTTAWALSIQRMPSARLPGRERQPRARLLQQSLSNDANPSYCRCSRLTTLPQRSFIVTQAARREGAWSLYRGPDQGRQLALQPGDCAAMCTTA